MRLQPDTEHPHGLPDREFDALFTSRQAGDLRLPRLPVADPPAHLPAHQPPQHPRARLQGGGHHHDAVRHGDAQRPRPLPPGDGRDRPGARARRAGAPGLRQEMVDERLRAPRLHARARRRHPRGARLDLAWRRAGADRRRVARSTDAPVPILVVNAGSSSLKLRARRRRRRHARRAASWRRRRPRWIPTSSDDALAGALAGADAVGHRIVHGGERYSQRPVDRRRASARAARPDRAGAAAPAEVAGGARRRHRALLPGRAGGRLLRHGLPRHPAAGGRHLRAARRAGASAGGCAATASTACRTPGSPAARRSCSAAPIRRCASSAATSAPARRCARSPAAARSTRRWASPRSRAW